jgi:hypothetical protein
VRDLTPLEESERRVPDQQQPGNLDDRDKPEEGDILDTSSQPPRRHLNFALMISVGFCVLFWVIVGDAVATALP